jgi:hypothetical protein
MPQQAPSTVWVIKEEQDRLKKHADYKNNFWICKETGAKILMIPFERTIWTDVGPGPCAGTGDVRTVFHIYCPECHKEPKENKGSPIQESELIQVGNG